MVPSDRMVTTNHLVQMKILVPHPAFIAGGSDEAAGYFGGNLAEVKLLLSKSFVLLGCSFPGP